MALPEHGPAASNRLASAMGSDGPRPRSTEKGDMPAALLDRYLVERDRQGRAERFFRDHRAREPMFRDTGRSLTTTQAYPDAVADMLKVARHRGWSTIRVVGDEAFRREVWVQSRALGLEVKGYRPRQRDRQAGGEAEGRDQAKPSPVHGRVGRTVEDRRKAASTVVRALVSDPEAQNRLIARAWTRAATHLDRFRPSPDLNPSRHKHLDRDR